MAHPIHHAKSSSKKFGGEPEDYQAIHDWFDETKAHTALAHHRALRHHTFGIFEAEKIFGRVIQLSNGHKVPTRWIGEQHVREDCRRIPTVADWLKGIPIESWMVNGVLLPNTEELAADPMEQWREAVAKQETTLGLTEWVERNAVLSSPAKGG